MSTERKAVTRIVLILLSIGILVSAFSIQPVKAQPDPDLNGDGVVDIKDIAIAASAFFSYPGHSRWNADADMDLNEIIDIRDICFVAINFG